MQMTKWSRQHEQERLRVLGMIQRRATPFPHTGAAARLQRTSQDFLPWCRTYLPHYFDCDFAPLHRRMVDPSTGAGEAGMPAFVASLRGSGKSVLLALARPLYRALRGEVPYFIYGSAVQKLAAQNMDYVRIELEHNPRVAGDYGELTVDGPETEWTLSVAAAGCSTKFEAFGIGMSPRGRRHAERRWSTPRRLA
jgi:hypothetical protein